MKGAIPESGPPSPRTQSLFVLVADRNAHFRETIRRVLAGIDRCVVSAEAATIDEVVSRVTNSRVDLLLLDVDLVTSDRLTGLKRLAESLPELKVAVLLSDDTPEYRAAVLRHGGHFSVAKDSLEEQIPPVLRVLMTPEDARPSGAR